MKPVFIFSAGVSLLLILFLIFRRRASTRTPPAVDTINPRRNPKGSQAATIEETINRRSADQLAGLELESSVVERQVSPAARFQTKEEGLSGESRKDSTHPSLVGDPSLFDNATGYSTDSHDAEQATNLLTFTPPSSEHSESSSLVEEPGSIDCAVSQQHDQGENSEIVHLLTDTTLDTGILKTVSIESATQTLCDTAKSKPEPSEVSTSYTVAVESQQLVAVEGLGAGDSESEQRHSGESLPKDATETVDRNLALEPGFLDEPSGELSDAFAVETRTHDTERNPDKTNGAPLHDKREGTVRIIGAEAKQQPIRDIGDGEVDESELAEASISQERFEETETEESSTSLRKYRPPEQRASRVPRDAAPQRAEATSTDVSLRIKVRMLFDRSGFCSIGLLPERLAGLDDEVLVRLQGDPISLIAQEDWYQDLELDGVSDHLRHGLELKGRLSDSRSIKWLLTGRDLYVLANHPRANGFVSTDRLAIGRTHIVLCTLELLREVETVLAEAGCEQYERLDESFGVPAGWAALRNVSPTRHIVLSAGSDRFYPIKPAPDIDIELTGGICLRNSVWIKGYPPRIHIVGQLDQNTKVRIDDADARTEADGSFVTDEYDAVGSHSVYCQGLSVSCTYSIEEPPQSWNEWDAYAFGPTYVCGPRVRRAAAGAPVLPFLVPMSNLLLLGAKPGQVLRCSPRRARHWKGFVPFEVVWALPTEPLRCDKRVARILAYTSSPVVSTDQEAHTLAWATAILDASRKGLTFLHDEPEVAERWKEYKKIARQIRRARR